MAPVTYLMSFTAGALLYRESLTVAELVAELADWDAVRDKTMAENRLQIRTTSAARRVYREIKGRLQTLTAAEMEILRDGSRLEQGYTLWLAICKRYQFIREFAVEVVREKYLRLDYRLAHEDFDIFFNARADWHAEVEKIEPSTRAKLRQVLFHMMRDAEILSSQGLIVPAILTPRLIAAMREDAPANLAIFPVSDADLKAWTQ